MDESRLALSQSDGMYNVPSVQMNVADHSGSQWLTCFQDTGMEILGKSAEELGELRVQV